jgi:hypothetical protein
MTVEARRKRPRTKIDRPVEEGPDEPASETHIPHISFNVNDVRVNEEAAPFFQGVPMAPAFRFIQLNGVEIEIANDPPGKPVVDPSYDQVVKKDQYWPEAANLWNRDYVPERGNQPKRSAVVGFMRFGSGRIKAGRLAPVQWKFERKGRAPLVGTFAEEVIYSDFPHSGDDVVLRLLDVETREMIQELRFSPARPDLEKLTLFIGNNDSDDIDNAVQQLSAIDMRDNVHFKFLNRVASIPDPGRIPRVIRPRVPVDPDLGGGVSTGPCGPTSSNG